MYVLVQKYQGPKKLWVQRKSSENISGPIIFGPKHLGLEKNFSTKRIAQKSLPKKVLDPK